jgi:hypothetical protein
MTRPVSFVQINVDFEEPAIIPNYCPFSVQAGVILTSSQSHRLEQLSFLGRQLAQALFLNPGQQPLSRPLRVHIPNLLAGTFEFKGKIQIFIENMQIPLHHSQQPFVSLAL